MNASLPNPIMTKIRLHPKATAKLLSWHINNPKPVLSITNTPVNHPTTAQVAVTKANLDDDTEGMPDDMKQLIINEHPSVTSREAILFSNILDLELVNCVCIDLPETTSEEYSFDQLKHIAHKTYTSFLGCKMMGWTTIATKRIGANKTIVDYIQILSAWLAGVNEIHFFTKEASKAFDIFTSQGVNTPCAYISRSRELLGRISIYDLYPLEKEVSWEHSPLEVGDIIRFNEAQHYYRDIFVYGIVTNVSAANVVKFKKLKTNETMVYDNWMELQCVAKYVSPIIPPDIDAAILASGVLRPTKGGSYNYDRKPVSVYVVLPSDRVYQEDRG